MRNLVYYTLSGNVQKQQQNPSTISEADGDESGIAIENEQVIDASNDNIIPVSATKTEEICLSGELSPKDVSIEESGDCSKVTESSAANGLSHNVDVVDCEEKNKQTNLVSSDKKELVSGSENDVSKMMKISDGSKSEEILMEECSFDPPDFVISKVCCS